MPSNALPKRRNDRTKSSIPGVPTKSRSPAAQSPGFSNPPSSHLRFGRSVIRCNKASARRYNKPKSALHEETGDVCTHQLTAALLQQLRSILGGELTSKGESIPLKSSEGGTEGERKAIVLDERNGSSSSGERSGHGRKEKLEWGKGRKGGGFLYAQERPSIAGSLIDLRHESKHDHDSP
jgi:hypothetical protein